MAEGIVPVEESDHSARRLRSFINSAQFQGRKDDFWIQSPAADMLFGAVILLNAIVIGIDIQAHLDPETGPPSLISILNWVQFGFLLIFVAELFLRIRADGAARYFSFRNNLSGLFDLVIILTSAFEYIITFTSINFPIESLSVMRVFRLLRIARIVRLLRVCPELTKLISALASSMRASWLVTVIIMVLTYICSLLCTMTLGSSDDEDLRLYFGRVGGSFYTHFKILTLEGFPAVAEAAGRESWLWYLYFVAFILLADVVLINLVTGIVCESVVSNSRTDELENSVYEAESTKFDNVLNHLLDNLGVGNTIKYDKFQEIIRDDNIRDALNTLGVGLEIEDYQLFQILDEDGSESLSRQELVSSCLRLRGSKETLHSLLVQADVIRGGQRVGAQIHEAQEQTIQYSKDAALALETRLQGKLQELREATLRAARSGGPSSLGVDPGASVAPAEGLASASSCGCRGAASSSDLALPAVDLGRAPADEARQLNLRELLANVEECTNEARASLYDLRVDLAASRSRVRKLEALLSRHSRNVEVQADEPKPPQREVPSGSSATLLASASAPSQLRPLTPPGASAVERDFASRQAGAVRRSAMPSESAGIASVPCSPLNLLPGGAAPSNVGKEQRPMPRVSTDRKRLQEMLHSLTQTPPACEEMPRASADEQPRIARIRPSSSESDADADSATSGTSTSS